MKKTKLLCILHYSPPAQGASKVGDFIKSSKKLKDEFNCKFIKIIATNTKDILLSAIWKFYKLLISYKTFYNYHTENINVRVMINNLKGKIYAI